MHRAPFYAPNIMVGRPHTIDRSNSSTLVRASSPFERNRSNVAGRAPPRAPRAAHGAHLTRAHRSPPSGGSSAI